MWTIPGLAAVAAVAASLYPLTLFLRQLPPAASDFKLFIYICIGTVAVCLVLARLVRVARVIAVLAVAWLALGLYAGGPPAALAFMLYAAAAVGLGTSMAARVPGLGALERTFVAYLCGVALLVAATSLVLQWPVHHPAVYTAACLAICLWRRRELMQLGLELSADCREAFQARLPTVTGLLALLAIVVGSCSATGVLIPIVSHDDLAYHLRLPYELLVQHRYSFDVVQHVWASAPWASDLAFAFPFVISAGAEGVKTWVAGSYHLAAAVLLFGLLRRVLATGPALLFLVGYLSIPLVLAANFTMHTEGLSAALIISIFLLWTMQRAAPSAAAALAACVLLGLLGAVKSSNLVACLCLGLLWLPSLWRQFRERPLVGVGLVAALATVAIPYATSWVRTGNPVLPLFNAVFKSPYFEPVNFTNPLFTGMFGPGLFTSLFLEAPRHLETGLGTAGGMTVFFLLLPALVLLAWRGDMQRRLAMAVALAFALLVLVSQQYLRYLFPVMGLAVYAASVVWDAPVASSVTVRRVWQAWWVALLLLAVVHGVRVMPDVSSQTSLQWLGRSLVPGGHDAYLRFHAPDRELNRVVNQHLGRHATVLYADGSFGADLQGRPAYASWYNTPLLLDFRTIKDLDGAAAFVKRHRITHVNPGRISTAPAIDVRAPAQVMVEFARAHGTMLSSIGEAGVFALEDDLVWRRVLWQLDKDPRAGTPIQMRNAISEGGAIKAGDPVLVEVEGTCDSPNAKPAIDLIWLRGDKNLGARGSIQGCVVDAANPNGRFTIRFQAEAPYRTKAFRLWLGALGDTPVRYRVARVRTLAAP